MYIEQGYKGKLGIWNAFILPVGFILLMTFNYFATKAFLDESGESTSEIMQTMIDQMGTLPFLAINLMVFVIGLIIVFIWVKFINGQSLTSFTTSRSKIDWKRIFTMFLIWAVFQGGMIFMTALNAPEDYVYNLQWDKFIPLVILSLLMFPFQTSFEEYLFRGQLLQGLGIATKSRAISWIVTSVLFGLMHAANPEVETLGPVVMVFYIGTGLLLGAMTLLDEGLELALGFHAANNITAALLMTSTWTAIQTDSVFIDMSEPTFAWTDTLSIFIGYPILLIILGKIYNWKNWKEKLFGRVLDRKEFFEKEGTNDPQSTPEF
ncbi:CPBP family intramembrane glutamic endopeptidase [Nonlabens tegetincola]|uniref:CPBP family intramembrane glutamic endopeptidase n=1 Tax=Nonlabens tegetincola TaxID=323273 RepID=UPI000CF50190|nr:CPBP family intramembrane glutamic endopeptidase [Nonlabens tegetincola]PQJ19424.1 CAAX protease family protein [Nonlabens tegetincola]